MKKTITLANSILILGLAYLVTLAVIFFTLNGEHRVIEGWKIWRYLILLLFVPLFFKYTIHLLIAPWYGLFTGKKFQRRTRLYFPKVSVIIPAWNEEVGIAHTMRTVLESTYRNLELIVVNDGSTDNTDIVIRTFMQIRPNDNIVYISKANGGKASALNLGIKKSTGEIIITTDADSIVDKNAIANMVKHFNREEVMSVAGNVRIGNNFKAIGAIQQLEYMYGFYFKRADSILNSIYIVGGAAAAYRRKIFDKLGMFDEHMITEDIEYSTRILEAGYRIRYAANALFYTEGPSDIKSLIKQRLRWKYGRFLTFIKYRKLFFSAKKRHSKFLTFVILPVALFAEILLFFEVILLSIFYTYVFLTGNLMPLIFAIILLVAVVVFQVITDVKPSDNKKLILLAPVVWLIFYFIDFIEYAALIISLDRIVKRKGVVWQKWKRTGVVECA